MNIFECGVTSFIAVGSIAGSIAGVVYLGGVGYDAYGVLGCIALGAVGVVAGIVGGGVVGLIVSYAIIFVIAFISWCFLGGPLLPPKKTDLPEFHDDPPLS